MKYIYLIAAIFAELIGALGTRQSEGFTKLVPSIVAVIGVVGAYYLLSLSLKAGMQIGVAYGIWAAVGISLLALVGYFAFKESLGTVQLLGLMLIIAGVLCLELGKTA